MCVLAVWWVGGEATLGVHCYYTQKSLNALTARNPLKTLQQHMHLLLVPATMLAPATHRIAARVQGSGTPPLSSVLGWPREKIVHPS